MTESCAQFGYVSIVGGIGGGRRTLGGGGWGGRARGARPLRQQRRACGGRMRLLVSVTNAHEARVAVEAGVDIVDVKNPAEGSLGAPGPGVIERVREVVPPERPVSAAIGDLRNLPGTAALAALGAARSGAEYVKVGLWGASSTDEAVALLRAVRDAVDGGATVIAAAYADAERVPAGPLPPDAVVVAARRAAVGGCLLDT